MVWMNMVLETIHQDFLQADELFPFLFFFALVCTTHVYHSSVSFFSLVVSLFVTPVAVFITMN